MARDPGAVVEREYSATVYRRRIDLGEGVYGYAVRLWVRQRNREGGLDGAEPWWVTFRDGEPVAVEFPLRFRPWKRDWEYAVLPL